MSRKALIVSATGLSPGPQEEPNAAAFRDMLRRAPYRFTKEEIKILYQADLTCKMVMDEITGWLVSDAKEGDVRLLAVTAHGGNVLGSGGQRELAFGFPADPATITDTALSQALAPLVAAGVQPWTFFDVCGEVSTMPAGFLERFEAHRRRLEGLFPMEEFLEDTKEFSTLPLRRFDQWNPPPVPAPTMVFASPLVNSLSMRGTIDSTGMYFPGWGGVFGRHLALAAGALPHLPAEKMIAAVWRGMLQSTLSQVPMLTGPQPQFSRRFPS